MRLGSKGSNLQTLKEVKGVLNKLTPEKFDILSKQLLQLVTNSETLHSTIALIFENAVAQPTFVAVYADLCNSPGRGLISDHQPAPGFHKHCSDTGRLIASSACIFDSIFWLIESLRDKDHPGAL